MVQGWQAGSFKSNLTLEDLDNDLKRPEEDLESDLKRHEKDLKGPGNDLKRPENDLIRHEEDLEGPHRKANLRTQVLRVSLGGRAVFPQPGLRIDRTASNGWQNDQNDINFLNFWTRRLNHVHQLFNFINISTRTCLVLSPITLAATGRYRCEVLGDRSYC